MTESNLNVLLVTCFTIFALGATIASGQQQPQQPPPPPSPPPQPQPQARRHIAKPGDVLPEADPLSPYSPRPQLYQQPQQWRPAPAPAYAPQYAPQKPELLFKHELFQHPEFKQLLLSKPELLKPEFSHILLAHMQQFYQKLAALKPQFIQQQSPYAPVPLNKYNQQPPPPKHLLEAEILKHKVEGLKPELTNLFNTLGKPHLLSPALPAPQPQPPLGQSTPLNEVPQFFVPIPAVQQPEPAQPAPQPTLLPGFEFLNTLPQLPSFTLPQLPTFDTSCLLFGNCSFGTLSQPVNPFLRPPQQPLQPGQFSSLPGQLPLQPGQPPLQPGQPPLQPGQLPGQQPLSTQLQSVPARSVPAGQEGLVVEEQKRANLLAGGGELPPEQAIGACLAKPREPLACATSPSDWDEIYEQPIDCPLSTPRVWKCHCGFFKVVESAQPQGPPSAGQPAAAGQPTFSLPGLPGLSPSGQLVPAPAPPA